jgi:hypothetical protein
MLAAGCGGDDNGGGPGTTDGGDMDATQPGVDGSPGTDGMTPPPGDSGPMTDSPVTGNDSGEAGGGGCKVEDGKLILVHAAMYAPGLRICLGIVHTTDAGSTVTIPKVSATAGGAPAPNTVEGVPPGTGGPAADTGTDFSDQAIELFAIDATKLTAQIPDAGAAELSCTQLIGTDGAGTGALPVADGGVGLALNTNYWDLGTIPKGQLKASVCADAGVTAAPSTTTLAIITGCGVGAPNPAYNCPGGTAGKLGLAYKTLDRTTALTAGDGGTIGAQFDYASFPFASFASLPNVGGAAAVAGFYTMSLVPAPVPDAGASDGGDAGDAAIDAGPQFIPVTTASLVAGPVAYSQLQPTSLVPVSGVTFDGTSGFFVNAIAADGGPTPLQVPIPLPTIHDLSWGPGVTTAPFQNGTGYVFLVLGDPNPAVPQFLGADGGAATADSGVFNPFAVHILGFPTNPPLPPAK